MSINASPKRSEVWLVNFDPTIGSEIRKVRPAVVVSSNTIGRLPIKLVAPITDWKDGLSRNSWHLKLEPNSINGLTKVSAVDTLQLRGLDQQRFVRRLGRLEGEEMMRTAAAIALGKRTLTRNSGYRLTSTGRRKLPYDDRTPQLQVD